MNLYLQSTSSHMKETCSYRTTFSVSSWLSSRNILDHSQLRITEKTYTIDRSFQTKRCRLGASKKNFATMALSCQHCRTIPALCKRNQPNAYHSDYQNHEGTCAGLDTIEFQFESTRFHHLASSASRPDVGRLELNCRNPKVFQDSNVH